MKTYIWYIEKRIGSKWIFVDLSAYKDSAIDLFVHYASRDPYTKYRFIKR